MSLHLDCVNNLKSELDSGLTYLNEYSLLCFCFCFEYIFPSDSGTIVEPSALVSFRPLALGLAASRLAGAKVTLI